MSEGWRTTAATLKRRAVAIGYRDRQALTGGARNRHLEGFRTGHVPEAEHLRAAKKRPIVVARTISDDHRPTEPRSRGLDLQ
jgi:hypothetical protein